MKGCGWPTLMRHETLLAVVGKERIEATGETYFTITTFNKAKAKVQTARSPFELLMILKRIFGDG